MPSTRYKKIEHSQPLLIHMEKLTEKSQNNSIFKSILKSLENLDFNKNKEKIKILLENLKYYENNNPKLLKKDNSVVVVLTKTYHNKNKKHGYSDSLRINLIDHIYALFNGNMFIAKMEKPHLVHFGNTSEITQEKYKIKKLLDIIKQEESYFIKFLDGENKKQIIELKKS